MATVSSAAVRRKLVIIGDGGCGKTSLLNVFAMGEFPEIYEPTIFENYVAEIRLDGKPVQLALWDTAGQEEYERLRPFSYSKSHVILIAFSLDTPDSLENVTVKWIEEVRELCGPKIPVILVGCKQDLRDAAPLNEQDQFVQKQQAELVAQDIDARCYMECSALKNEGVDHIFEVATRSAMLVRSSPSSGPNGGGAGGGAGGGTSGGNGVPYGSSSEKSKRKVSKQPGTHFDSNQSTCTSCCVLC